MATIPRIPTVKILVNAPAESVPTSAFGKSPGTRQTTRMEFDQPALRSPRYHVAIILEAPTCCNSRRYLEMDVQEANARIRRVWVNINSFKKRFANQQGYPLLHHYLPTSAKKVPSVIIHPQPTPSAQEKSRKIAPTPPVTRALPPFAPHLPRPAFSSNIPLTRYLLTTTPTLVASPPIPHHPAPYPPRPAFPLRALPLHPPSLQPIQHHPALHLSKPTPPSHTLVTYSPSIASSTSTALQPIPYYSTPYYSTPYALRPIAAPRTLLLPPLGTTDPALSSTSSVPYQWGHTSSGATPVLMPPMQTSIPRAPTPLAPEQNPAIQNIVRRIFAHPHTSRLSIEEQTSLYITYQTYQRHLRSNPKVTYLDRTITRLARDILLSPNDGFVLFDAPEDPLVGRGGYKNIYHAVSLSNGFHCAVAKCPFPDRLHIPEQPATHSILDHRDMFYREVSFTTLFKNSPHIVQILLHVEAKQTGYFVMPFYEGGTLFEYFKQLGDNPHSLATKQKLHIAKTMLEALHTIHAEEIVHRDIKGENIFFDRHGNPFLGDFGFAAKKTEREGEFSIHAKHGTAVYFAPELWKEHSSANALTDIWALGIVIYELFTQQTASLPWIQECDKASVENLSVQQMIKRVQPFVPQDPSWRPPFPVHSILDPDYAAFERPIREWISNMLSLDLGKRMRDHLMDLERITQTSPLPPPAPPTTPITLAPASLSTLVSLPIPDPMPSLSCSFSSPMLSEVAAPPI